MAKNTLGIVLPRFMEAIHVELPDKAVDFLMPKKSREDYFLKLIDILYDKIFAGDAPKYYFTKFFILNN